MAESDEERELRKLMEDMTVESKLPSREQRLHHEWTELSPADRDSYEGQRERRWRAIP